MSTPHANTPAYPARVGPKSTERPPPTSCARARCRSGATPRRTRPADTQTREPARHAPRQGSLPKRRHPRRCVTGRSSDQGSTQAHPSARQAPEGPGHSVRNSAAQPPGVHKSSALAQPAGRPLYPLRVRGTSQAPPAGTPRPTPARRPPVSTWAATRTNPRGQASTSERTRGPPHPDPDPPIPAHPPSNPPAVHTANSRPAPAQGRLSPPGSRGSGSPLGRVGSVGSHTPHPTGLPIESTSVRIGVCRGRVERGVWVVCAWGVLSGRPRWSGIPGRRQAMRPQTSSSRRASLSPPPS